jgi:hypothetical protein
MLHRRVVAVLVPLLGLPLAANAQVTSLDRALIGLHYYHDYEAAGQEDVSVTSQGNGLSLLQFDQTFHVAHGGQSRHVGELANNPDLPYEAPPSESWDFSATVRIGSSSTAATQGGLHVGHLGTNWPPGDANAATGVFAVLPDGGGEIAVFGAWLPFWSNNLPGYGNFPRAVRGQDFTLRMVFDAPSLSFTYFVNGLQAGPFAMDPASITFLMDQGGQALGVFAGATPHAPGDTAETVFTNISAVPSPASMLAMVLGGVAMACRRRRPG